jgi:MoaA/NifB/PqqE/SkfB family radical SAM enzyme
MQGIKFANGWDETITIGGGEPTLHPDFWEILRECLGFFDYVWMATNGSQTHIMYDLSALLDEGFCHPEQECTCEQEDLDNGYDCECYGDYIQTNREDQFAVALSQDCFHDPIDQRVVDLWTRRSKARGSGYEVRDVTRGHNGVIAQGRAKRENTGWNEDDCPCGDIIIKPDGRLKLCGCTGSPIIGDVWDGMEKKWEEVWGNPEYEGFHDTRCWKSLKGKV